jgi:hypothetical protein
LRFNGIVPFSPEFGIFDMKGISGNIQSVHFLI